MLRQWDTGEALRADGAAVPHVPPQYRRRFPHIARWSVAAATPDAVSAVSAGNAYTDAAYKRDKPFWSGLLSGGHDRTVVHLGALPAPQPAAQQLSRGG